VRRLVAEAALARRTQKSSLTVRLEVIGPYFFRVVILRLVTFCNRPLSRNICHLRAVPQRRNIEGTKAHAGDHERCLAVREVLKLVGDKWSVLIVGVCSGRAAAVLELKRRIEGISNGMPHPTLRGLERGRPADPQR